MQMTDSAAPRPRRSSALAWLLVVAGVLFPPLGIVAPPLLAQQGYIRWTVAAFASLLSVAEIVWILVTG